MPIRSLRDYHRKRDFSRTTEPKGTVRRRPTPQLSFVIQKHAASRLHFDFRLEWNGTLLSWAVPKGPSENVKDKRLAIHVEDHPLEYGEFEGTIPKGEYGGGTVMLWDQGSWQPHDVDVSSALQKGKLSFRLNGHRLQGNWALVRLRKRSAEDADNWLLIKEQDEFELEDGKLLATEREVLSVKSARSMEEIAAGGRVWRSNRGSSTSRTSAAAAVHVKQSKKTLGRTLKAGVLKLPPFIEPQLATLVDEPPSGEDWLHEIKYDGYRAVTSVCGDRVAIRTRNGLDWTDKFDSLHTALRTLSCESAVLDGEIAVADKEGRTDFGALQNVLTESADGLAYYLFDLLELDGVDLRQSPLVERKAALKKLISPNGRGPLMYSDHINGAGDKMFVNACRLQLEGIISKQANAPYRSGRHKSWLKIKCGHEQEFVIIGWRPSDKVGRPFSSLLLAVRDEGQYRYAGRVGSGYSGAGLDDLSTRLNKLGRKSSAAVGVPSSIARHAHFVEPELAAEIAFRGWTRDGLIRQGSFKGLRSDKPATKIVKEMPVPMRDVASAKKSLKKTKVPSKTRGQRVTTASDGAEDIEGVRVTNPDKVLFADQGVTKRELIAHYLSVARWMLPHIAGRPISLVRCPQGSGSQCFFQKHASDGFPTQFKPIRIREKSGDAIYLYIEDECGLVAAVQVGVLELHLWGSRVVDVQKPDRMVFDFDPDEGLSFSHVRRAAKDMRVRLQDLGLESFPMVTGGKGVHVVVPLKPGHSWEEHRNFSEALARVMAAEEPSRFVANMSKAKRKGKIFVDYLRNQRGATAISPFSTRSKAGAYVAVPVSWEKLARLEDAQPASVGETIKIVGRSDPWPSYFKVRQKLPKLKI